MNKKGHKTEKTKNTCRRAAAQLSLPRVRVLMSSAGGGPIHRFLRDRYVWIRAGDCSQEVDGLGPFNVANVAIL
jgi:hypothetical protein